MQARTGLILSGGGASAAYQIGVLKAHAVIFGESGWDRSQNPFPIICGTSAGALNAAGLACRADDFTEAVGRLAMVWEHFRADQVYRADSLGVMRSGARWLSLLSFGWLLRRWHANPPASLLDNTPLVTLLHRLLDFPRLDAAIESGALHALAVTASSYTSGEHCTFYQSRSGIVPWQRSQRLAHATQIGVEHLLASAAIPLIFPAVPLYLERHCEYFGDGSMRQLSPISPAIHLGASRVLVIGAGRLIEPPRELPERALYPSLAQIGGHALSGIFLDALAIDIERSARINHTLSLMDKEQQAGTALRQIDMLVIAPSQRLDDIAARHVHHLPRPMRALLAAVGGMEVGGAALASYLLFEEAYTKELVALGMQDTMALRAEVTRFFGLGAASLAADEADRDRFGAGRA